MKVLLLLSFSLVGFDNDGGSCYSKPSCELLSVCNTQLTNDKIYLRNCQKKRKQQGDLFRSQLSYYMCKFIKLGDERYPKSFRWPASSIDTYNQYIKKIFRWRLDEAECVWQSVSNNGFNEQHDCGCQERLEQCNRDHLVIAKKLAVCEKKRSTYAEHLKIYRSNYACAIKELSKKMPEGRQALERIFSKSERRITHKNSRFCRNLKKEIKQW